MELSTLMISNVGTKGLERCARFSLVFCDSKQQEEREQLLLRTTEVLQLMELGTVRRLLYTAGHCTRQTGAGLQAKPS